MFDTVIIHPENMKMIHAYLEKVDINPKLVGGIDIIVDKNIPKDQPTGRTVLPKWKFVEWEEEDCQADSWVNKLGFGKPEVEPVFYGLSKYRSTVLGVSTPYIKTTMSLSSLSNQLRGINYDFCLAKRK